MQHIIDRDKLFKIHENFNVSKDSVIWVHHPITEDLIKVSVVKSQSDKVLVTVLEDSPYIGQPAWWIKKLQIIGVNANH